MSWALCGAKVAGRRRPSRAGPGVTVALVRVGQRLPVVGIAGSGMRDPAGGVPNHP